jgi:hypothetical protein
VYVAGVDNGVADVFVIFLAVEDFDDALMEIPFIAGRAEEVAAVGAYVIDTDFCSHDGS